MSELFVVGVSHRTAPLDVRERLSSGAGNLAKELADLMRGGALGEGMVVSTCNRVEVYGSVRDPEAASEAARAYFRSRGGADVEPMLYEQWGEDAVRHAFRVASSLDSMVVGEPQILGQLKQAYEAAAAVGAMGSLLGRCVTRAFAVAKRVRTETDIAHGTVSVSSIACDLARRIFGELRGRRALLIGAGEMGEAAAKSLASAGASLRVVNRSAERAARLAEACGGEPRGYEQLASEMVAADVVISSTSSDRFVITRELMRDVARARRHRPLFIIDIAVPRDVDPRCHEMDNVFLYDVDDLQQVADENLAARRLAAEVAERIVTAEVEAFEQWRRGLTLTPTIVAMRARFREILRGELERTLPRLSSLSPKERKSLEKMCDAMANKLLHAPLTHLKEGADGPDGPALIDTTRRLFELETAEAAREDPQLVGLGARRRGDAT